jgi:Fe-S-cluster containining protein
MKTITLASGCHGGCCAVFWLPREIPPGALEGDVIRDMRIELTPEQVRERWARFIGTDLPYDPEDYVGTDMAQYTCRNWDEDTRLCTIYEQRPIMCRGYPYGQLCSHGCDIETTADWHAK